MWNKTADELTEVRGGIRREREKDGKLGSRK